MSLLLTFLFVQRGNTNIMSGSVGKVSYCNICRLCNKDYLSVAWCFIEEDNEGADHQSCCLYSDCPTLRIQSESREDTRTAPGGLSTSQCCGDLAWWHSHECLEIPALTFTTNPTHITHIEPTLHPLLEMSSAAERLVWEWQLNFFYFIVLITEWKSIKRILLTDIPPPPLPQPQPLWMHILSTNALSDHL